MPLSDQQRQLIASLELPLVLDEAALTRWLEADVASLSDEALLALLQAANICYRAGEPFVSDDVYDHRYLAELQKRHPEHPYLHQVEPEAPWGKTVALPQRMLSTEKAYDQASVERWWARCAKAAQEIGLDPEKLLIKITPKLDGFAAYDDGEMLYTRGDGRRGSDISRVFARGLQVAGDGRRGQGAGEIVVSRRYFQQHLAAFFDNTRNFQASIIKEKELDEHVLAAIACGAAVFFPFVQLPAQWLPARELFQRFEQVIDEALHQLDYDVDGVVIELTDEALKTHLGATRHHHRWQIAFKPNPQSAEVRVHSVTPQTSRSGRVNPVAELEPVRLSGALISRATAHHYGFVKQAGIGPGTLIELTRSGLVIPKIAKVLEAQDPQIPKQCPSCGSELEWDGDYLFCLNAAGCPAQIEHTLEHFFKTLGNADGFGEKTIRKLHAHGITSVYAVYQLTTTALQAMGFGDKTAQNLIDQLQRSRSEPLEDWRFLGAWGIHRMGLGNCERLLQYVSLTQLFDLHEGDIAVIPGFADKTAHSVVVSLAQLREEFWRVYGLGFNLITTPRIDDAPARPQASPIAGKTIVFTGTLQRGTREALTRQAKALGAKVASSVTSHTDYLVAGDNTGASKLAAAQAKAVTILSEQDYYALLAEYTHRT